jgi:hypothetical protein
MRQKTINIYKFDELEKEIQDKIIEKWQNDLYYLDYEWYDFLLDEWEKKLDNIGFENAQIEFSGFCSQGDGASFTADINLEKVINTLIMCDIPTIENSIKYLKINEIIKKGIYDIDFSINRFSNRYSHENTCDCEYSLNYYNVSDYWLNVIDNLKNDIEDLRLNLCYKIYSNLEDEYEYLLSYDCVKEHIRSNEYEFTENGKIY